MKTYTCFILTMAVSTVLFNACKKDDSPASNPAVCNQQTSKLTKLSFRDLRPSATFYYAQLLEYDERGRLVSSRDSATGRQMNVTYNEADRTAVFNASQTSSSNYRSILRFDKEGNLIESISYQLPDSGSISSSIYRYAPSGRLAYVLDYAQFQNQNYQRTLFDSTVYEWSGDDLIKAIRYSITYGGIDATFTYQYYQDQAALPFSEALGDQSAFLAGKPFKYPSRHLLKESVYTPNNANTIIKKYLDPARDEHGRLASYREVSISTNGTSSDTAQGLYKFGYSCP